MTVWGSWVLPRVTDRVLDSGTVRRHRDAIGQASRGVVLDVGFGTGTNLPHYGPRVDRVHAVEPNDGAWGLSAQARSASRVPVDRVGVDAAHLELPTHSVDTVVTAFTLCTVRDLPASIDELVRVLRPGGSLLFLEHGLAPDPGVRRWQRRLDAVEVVCAGGCHLVRDPVRSLEEASLQVTVASAAYLPGPALVRPWGWVTRGAARAADSLSGDTGF